MTGKQIDTKEETGVVMQSILSLTGFYWIFITERLNKGIKGFAPEKSQNLQGTNQNDSLNTAASQAFGHTQAEQRQFCSQIPLIDKRAAPCRGIQPNLGHKLKGLQGKIKC